MLNSVETATINQCYLTVNTEKETVILISLDKYVLCHCIHGLECQHGYANLLKHRINIKNPLG